MSTLPGQVENAARDAGHEGQVAGRREDPDVRGSAASGGDDATGNDATSARESAIDDAVEMTFPASDPPAWMPSGVPRPVADAAGGTSGGEQDARRGVS